LVELFCLCFEAVLVRDCEAIDSADLGTSSKESYWDYNRGWPKRRKVPCCSLVRRGWVSPERMAETVLKQPLNPLFYICFGRYFSTFSGFARTGSWLIFQHQYSFSAFLFLLHTFSKFFFLSLFFLFGFFFFFFLKKKKINKKSSKKERFFFLAATQKLGCPR